MRCTWLLCLLVPAVLAAPVEDEDNGGKKWAVLVAGSNTWWNYRHQADICHAYQILHRHGIPDSNIIVFMYDDIAQNPNNPNPGVIINNPNGTNVYGPKAVNKDYTGDDVTPQNFLNALTGDSSAANGKKVLKSGPNDHVFVYYADHGATGIIGFPNDVLYSDDLIKALKKMHTKKMYKKLLFYMEACEAGSMFKSVLPENINIIATTAANPDESSYGTYCDGPLDTCLGDEYSVAWMEDTDAMEGAKLQKETIEKQFKDVVAKVAESHPQMYGQTKLKSDKLKDFIGVGNKTVESYETPAEMKLSVRSRDVMLHSLKRQIEMTNDEEKLSALEEQLEAYIEGRETIDELFADIMSSMEATDDEINKHSTLTVEMMPCYKTIVESFRQQCVNIVKNTYTMGELYKFANLCARDNFSPEEVLDVFAEECTDVHRQLTGIN